MLVINKFLEFWYCYVVDVLTDTQVYSEHASKSAMDIDDVNLAIQSKVNFNFSQPPCLEVLLELAKGPNKSLQQDLVFHFHLIMTSLQFQTKGLSNLIMCFLFFCVEYPLHFFRVYIKYSPYLIKFDVKKN